MGQWVEFQVVDPTTSGGKTTRKIPVKGYFRGRVYQTLQQNELDNFSAVYKADFIYQPENNRILKNRHGSVEELYESAQRYMHLRHHPNEAVRRAFEKVETLAAMAEETVDKLPT